MPGICGKRAQHAFRGVLRACTRHVRQRDTVEIPVDKARICQARQFKFQFPAGTKKFNGEIAKENEFHKIVRGLLIADVTLPGDTRQPLRLGVTHLDHMDVAQRRIQLQHLVREFDRFDGIYEDSQNEKGVRIDEIYGDATASLLMGDLNALTREDYGDDEWLSLEDRARSRNWQLPQHGDLEILRRAFFKDVVEVVQGKRGADLRTAPARNPIYRIDYGWIRGKSAQPLTAEVVDDAVVSDHLPFMLDLEVAATPGECKL